MTRRMKALRRRTAATLSSIMALIAFLAVADAEAHADLAAAACGQTAEAAQARP